MVTILAWGAQQEAVRAWPLVLAVEERAEPLLVRLDPEQRAKVLMALLGLILLGAFSIALVYFGGAHLRRIARSSPGASRDTRDDWYRKPLVPPDPPSPHTSEPE